MQFDPTRSTSAGYWRLAAEYVIAAQSVNARSERLLFPCMQLHGQAIELALKAFLLKRGTTLQDVESMRHRLTDILKAARSRRLGLEIKLHANDLATIYLLDQNYSIHRFRYIVTGATRVPEMARLLYISERIVAGLEKYCTGMRFGLSHISPLRK